VKPETQLSVYIGAGTDSIVIRVTLSARSTAASNSA
jgi:hypothetical protein